MGKPIIMSYGSRAVAFVAAPPFELTSPRQQQCVSSSFQFSVISSLSCRHSSTDGGLAPLFTSCRVLFSSQCSTEFTQEQLALCVECDQGSVLLVCFNHLYVDSALMPGVWPVLSPAFSLWSRSFPYTLFPHMHSYWVSALHWLSVPPGTDLLKAELTS